MKSFFKTTTGKVALSLAHEQFKWSIWYFVILAGVYVLVDFNITINDNEFLGNFMSFSQHSTSIYMFVIGIISIMFIKYYVKKGVTRRELFFGIALGALGLSITLSLMGLILTGLFHFVLNGLQVTDLDMAPYLEGYTNIFAVFIVYMLNILTYYFIGWLVGVGYYRYKWIIGFGFVALAISAASIVEFLWTFDASFLFNISGPVFLLTLPARFFINVIGSVSSVPFFGALIANLLLIALLLWGIRMITKRVQLTVH